MKEQLISFETAKLAKEKGFELNIAAYNYSEENNFELGFNVYTKQDLIDYKIYPAPTQSLLQKWLREIHDIHIIVWKVNSPKGWFFGINVSDWRAGTREVIFNTYEQALEKGLQAALKLI